MRKVSLTLIYGMLLFFGESVAFNGYAQMTGTFVNLDFESAISPLVPGPVPETLGIPGWTSYFRADHTIEYNNDQSSGPNIVIWGPESPPDNILSGNYSLTLRTALGGFGSVAIGQTGQIPPDASWLLFNGHPGTSLQLTFGGEALPYMRIRIRDQYDVFGADVSALSGQTGELRFTAVSDSTAILGFGLIDDIRFSAIPEPHIASIIAAGIALFGVFNRRSSRRTVEPVHDGPRREKTDAFP